jgi:predicted nucleic acid-binding Zn ribbon protein
MHNMAFKDGWKSAAEVLRAVLPNLASAERLQEYRVWEVWEEAVGRLVARKAQPKKIQHGKLFVTVGNSVYLQEMQFYKMHIRDAVNQRLGAPLIKDIFFVLGRVQDVAIRPEPPPPLRPLPPYSELQVPKLNRPELQSAFASLLAARRRRLKEKPRG